MNDYKVISLEEIMTLPEDRDLNKSKRLSLSEKEVLKYLFENVYITNKICREELGYGKTKCAQIFKGLVELGKIEKMAQGPMTYYILK